MSDTMLISPGEGISVAVNPHSGRVYSPNCGATLDIASARLSWLARAAMHRAVCPATQKRVGAAILTQSGNVYLGANIEFGWPCELVCIHAEQLAVANAVLNDDAILTALAVTHTPCGHCSEFLLEFADPTKLRIMLSGQPLRVLSD